MHVLLLSDVQSDTYILRNKRVQKVLEQTILTHLKTILVIIISKNSDILNSDVSKISNTLGQFIVLAMLLSVFLLFCYLISKAN